MAKYPSSLVFLRIGGLLKISGEILICSISVNSKFLVDGDCFVKLVEILFSEPVLTRKEVN